MKNARHLIALILALLVSGCAELPPYRRPSAEATGAEREDVYARKKAGYGWMGYTIGGEFPGIHSWNPAYTYADYYGASGDLTSAARVRLAGTYNAAGLAAGVVGIAAMFAMTPPGARTMPSEALLAGVAGLSAEVAIIQWGRKRHFEPAAESFNRYLRQDLGLNEDGTALTPSARVGMTELPPEPGTVDELVTTAGRVLVGTIEVQKPSEFVRIRTEDQRLFEIEWKDIRRLNGKPVEDFAGPRAAAQELSATAGLKSAVYGFAGSGFSLVSTYDLADYYLIPGATNSANAWPWTENGVPQLVLGAGYVAPNGATLELRFDMQARGQFGRYYTLPGGDKTPAWANNTVGLALGLVPGYTVALHRLPKQRSVDLFLGCELGLGYLMSKGIKGDSSGNELGSYYLRSPTFSGGPLLRLCLPFPYGDHWGLGLELGYRLEEFTDIHVADSYGVFAGRPSPDRTLRGTESVVDLSGPFFNVTVMFGEFQFSK